MQAANTLRRFSVGRVGFVVLILSVVLNVALGLLALAQADYLIPTGRNAQEAPRLVAHSQPGMGEGLVGQALVAHSSAMQAHSQPSMGEGRLNMHREPVLPTAPFVAGLGEGWLGNGVSRVFAPSCGQGEGLVQHAILIENPCETR
jgi:hypothetical protein